MSDEQWRDIPGVPHYQVSDGCHGQDMGAHLVTRLEAIRRRLDDPSYDARADIPDLLRVVEAARLVKAQCDDMCPSWYDEPCDCGMDALRAALADLDR